MKTKNIILIFIIVALGLSLGLGFVRQQQISHQSASKHHELWYCPMHPWILYDHPGKCPICGMDLVQKQETPVQETSAVKGYTDISLSQQRQQLIGVRTAEVVKGDILKTIRAAGEYQHGHAFAQVFEEDIPYIKIGQKAIVQMPAFHRTYQSSVLSYDNDVDETMRTANVWVWMPTFKQNAIWSNMLVNVEFPVKLATSLVIPREAIMDTGLRKIVFVAQSEGRFEPREIQTGLEGDNNVEVISGLKLGEQVVVSGNFLLDSESRIQAGQQG